MQRPEPVYKTPAFPGVDACLAIPILETRGVSIPAARQAVIESSDYTRQPNQSAKSALKYTFCSLTLVSVYYCAFFGPFSAMRPVAPVCDGTAERCTRHLETIKKPIVPGPTVPVAAFIPGVLFYMEILCRRRLFYCYIESNAEESSPLEKK